MMVMRDVDISISEGEWYVACINDIMNDYSVYTFIALSNALADLQVMYPNPYYRFMTLQEYMSLDYDA